MFPAAANRGEKKKKKAALGAQQHVMPSFTLLKVQVRTLSLLLPLTNDGMMGIYSFKSRPDIKRICQHFQKSAEIGAKVYDALPSA